MNPSPPTMMLCCPGCRAQIQARLEDAGQPCQCPLCGVGFYLPASPVNNEFPPGPGPGWKPSHPGISTSPKTTPTASRRTERPPTAPAMHIPPAVKKTSPGTLEKVMGAVFTLGVLGFGFLWFSQREGDPVPASIARTMERPASISNVTPVSHDISDPAPESSATLPGGFPARHIRAEAVRPDGRRVLAGLSDRRADIPQTARRVHALLDRGGSRNFAYLAEIDNDDQVLWLSVFGGDFIDPAHAALTRDGGIVVAGVALERFHRISLPGVNSIAPNGPVLVKLGADGTTVSWIRSGGAASRRVRSLHEDRQGNIVWTTVRKTGPETPRLHRLDANGAEIASGR